MAVGLEEIDVHENSAAMVIEKQLTTAPTFDKESNYCSFEANLPLLPAARERPMQSSEDLVCSVLETEYNQVRRKIYQSETPEYKATPIRNGYLRPDYSAFDEPFLMLL